MDGSMDGRDSRKLPMLLKHVGKLQEESVALCSSLTKPGRPLLVSQLDQAKRRLESVNEEHLNVVLIDGSVDLVEDFNKEVWRKIVGRPNHMNPRAFSLRVRLKYQASQ